MRTVKNDTLDVAAAVERVRESRASHVAWADHLAECGHCQAHPPEYIHGRDEQQQIVAEYDNVLACLKSLAAVEALADGWDEEVEAISLRAPGLEGKDADIAYGWLAGVRQNAAAVRAALHPDPSEAGA